MAEEILLSAQPREFGNGKSAGANPEDGAGELTIYKCNSATTCRQSVLLMFVSTLIGKAKMTCTQSSRKRKHYILNYYRLLVTYPITILFTSDIKNDLELALTEFNRCHKVLPV